MPALKSNKRKPGSVSVVNFPTKLLVRMPANHIKEIALCSVSNGTTDMQNDFTEDISLINFPDRLVAQITQEQIRRVRTNIARKLAKKKAI